jgi:hypothetical protein
MAVYPLLFLLLIQKSEDVLDQAGVQRDLLLDLKRGEKLSAGSSYRTKPWCSPRGDSGYQRKQREQIRLHKTPRYRPIPSPMRFQTAMAFLLEMAPRACLAQYLLASQSSG